MAISINSSSQEYSHSGNPLVFVFSSDETAQANFSYAVEVSVNGTLVERHKIFPESGIYAHFDASDVCERYCNVPTKVDSILIDTDSTIELTIDVIENYGTPPVDVLNDNITINVLKGKLTKRNFLTYNNTDYVFANDTKWLTLYPRTLTRYINLAYPNKFSFITNEESLKLKAILYDSSNNVVATYTAGSFAAKPKITTVTIRKNILLNDFGFTLGNLNDTSYMTIAYFNAANTYCEVYRLDIDTRCYSTTPKHLVFLSTLGSLESYTFIKRSKEDVSIKGEEIEQQFGYFDENSNFTFALGGVTDYVKLIENKQTLQTDWIDETEYLWLCQELLTSPLVYLYQDGNLLPVKVTESGYDVKTNYNDTVFNLTVKIHVDNDTSTVV